MESAKIIETETHSAHVTPAGGNVFADLGFEPAEAEALKAQSRRVIAERQEAMDSTSHPTGAGPLTPTTSPRKRPR